MSKRPPFIGVHRKQDVQHALYLLRRGKPEATSGKSHMYACVKQLSFLSLNALQHARTATNYNYCWSTTQEFIFKLLLHIKYFIQHWFICRPSDSTVSEDVGIEPRTVTTLTVARSHNLKISQNAYFLLLWFHPLNTKESCVSLPGGLRIRPDPALPKFLDPGSGSQVS